MIHPHSRCCFWSDQCLLPRTIPEETRTSGLRLGDQRQAILTTDKLSRCSLLVSIGLVGEEQLEGRENELEGCILEDLED